MGERGRCGEGAGCGVEMSGDDGWRLQYSLQATFPDLP